MLAVTNADGVLQPIKVRRVGLDEEEVLGHARDVVGNADDELAVERRVQLCQVPDNAHNVAEPSSWLVA
ncbi:hypothetical protein D3C85_1708630 [compost metagenome]